jgi:AcrR family transcriptional regulator
MLCRRNRLCGRAQRQRRTTRLGLPPPPRGRSQLAAAATAYGADWIAEELQHLLADGDFAAALDGFLHLWTGIVLEENFEAGCAVAAGALDPADDSPARSAAAEGFRRWVQILTDAFAQHIERPQAEALAMMCIASVEGALVLVRAERSLRPLQIVGQQLAQLAAVILPPTAAPTSVEPS